jgi:pimeloyl-ACP methyl ester carboxylesterase
VAPRLAARTTRAVGGRLLVLPGVGHVSQIEAPEAVAAGVAGLWDEVASGKMADD